MGSFAIEFGARAGENGSCVEWRERSIGLAIGRNTKRPWHGVPLHCFYSFLVSTNKEVIFFLLLVALLTERCSRTTTDTTAESILAWRIIMVQSVPLVLVQSL